MHASKLNKFDINYYFSLPTRELMQIANSCNWSTFKFQVGVLRLSKARKGLNTATVKIHTHKFCLK